MSPNCEITPHPPNKTTRGKKIAFLLKKYPQSYDIKQIHSKKWMWGVSCKPIKLPGINCQTSIIISSILVGSQNNKQCNSPENHHLNHVNTTKAIYSALTLWTPARKIVAYTFHECFIAPLCIIPIPLALICIFIQAKEDPNAMRKLGVQLQTSVHHYEISCPKEENITPCP